jgi:mono/diheme cytochrome c family protein
MKILKIALLSTIATGLIFSFAFGAGNVAKGKILFNDPKLGGGTAGDSCNSCHQDGKGLEKAADRKDLVKTVNLCIENALKGKGIDPKSEDMADLVAYLKSLKGKKPPAEAPKKK